MAQSDFHMLDLAINQDMWDRALVSFNYTEFNKRYHIGTGFLYFINNKIFLITAKHVISEALESHKNVTASFQINKNGEYIENPINNLKFSYLDEYDLAFANVDEFMESLPVYFMSGFIKYKPSTIAFRYRNDVSNLNDAFFTNNELLFGYTSVENTIPLKFNPYKFYWRTLLAEKHEEKNLKCSIKSGVFLKFDKKDMIELDNDLELKEHRASGNYPSMKGMSGGPCIRPKIRDKALIIDNISGVIIELLRKPPFNEKIIVIAPIEPIVDRIAHSND